MKKVISIVLIALILLNIMGYYVLFVGLQYTNELSMKHQLNEDSYEVSQTVTIKIPLAVPYMSDNNEFQRVDGMFEYEGEFYRLVKQKYAQDTLTVICIKDFKKKQIQEALTDYVKTLTDKPVNSKQGGKVSVQLLKDYYISEFSLRPATQRWKMLVLTPSEDTHLISSYLCSIVHPPNRI